MGVNGLLPFLRKNAEQSLFKKGSYALEFLRNKTISVDVAIMMHKVGPLVRQTPKICQEKILTEEGAEPKNSSNILLNQQEIGHEETASVFCEKLLNLHKQALTEYNIKLIWVFDGTDAQHDKADERQVRSLKRKRTEEITSMKLVNCKAERELLGFSAAEFLARTNQDVNTLQACLKSLSGKEAVAKAEQITSYLEMTQRVQTIKAQGPLGCMLRLGEIRTQELKSGNQQHVSASNIEELKAFFVLNNVSTVQAKGEAERCCVWMVKTGLADAAATDDSDAFAHGCPLILRNFTNIDSPKIELWDFSTILTSLQFDYPMFITFCLLCGNDFCENLDSLGPSAAFKLVKAYRDLEEIDKSILFGKYRALDNYDLVKKNWPRAMSRLAMLSDSLKISEIV